MNITNKLGPAPINSTHPETPSGDCGAMLCSALDLAARIEKEAIDKYRGTGGTEKQRLNRAIGWLAYRCAELAIQNHELEYGPNAESIHPAPNRSHKSMNPNQTSPKPTDAEKPTDEGLDETTCSQCCGAELVMHRLLSVEWEIAGSAVYTDEDRERVESITEREPNIDPPSIYCESCAKCGAVVRGWVEPDPVFHPANAEQSRPIPHVKPE